MNHFVVLLLVSLASTAWASKSRPVCGESTDSKNFILISPSLPPRECRYYVKAYSKEVCQLRLDFSFVLAQPTIPASNNNLKYVECVNDYFYVNGMKFCGVEKNQHIYVPLNRSAGQTEIEMDVVMANRGGGSTLPTAVWDIEVNQLECPSGSSLRELDIPFEEPSADAVEELQVEEAEEGKARSTFTKKLLGHSQKADAAEEEAVEEETPVRTTRLFDGEGDGFYLAPVGCLQYFPQKSGVIQSFNFNNGKGIYPGRLNYAICFRRTKDTHDLVLEAPYFNLGAENPSSSLLQVDNQCYPQLRTEGISEDYLMVPQGIIDENDVRASYYCGNSIQGTSIHTSNPGPISIVFNSDGVVKGTEAGFQFNYRIVDL